VFALQAPLVPPLNWPIWNLKAIVEFNFLLNAWPPTGDSKPTTAVSVAGLQMLGLAVYVFTVITHLVLPLRSSNTIVV
jgi:hypothetical protein